MSGNPGGSRASKTADVDRALALRDVMEHVVAVQKDTGIPPAERRSRRRAVLVAACIPVLALSLWSWVARPEFIWGARPRPAAPQYREANARATMFLVTRRLEAYRRDNGSYPATLADLGPVAPGIRYRLISDAVYELRSGQGANEIAYRSDQSAAEFVGDALSLLAGARP